MGRGRRGSRAREEGRGSANRSLPSREGLAAAANSHLVRRLRLASPGPRGGLLLLLHGCHCRRPALALTSSRALQTRGPSLGSDLMSQAPGALRISGRDRGSDGVGGGERREGKTSSTRQAFPRRIPSSATADPLTPHSPRPPPPQSVQSLGDQTRPSGKLVERRAAGKGHLTALERRRAAPEKRGSHSTAVRAPRPPGGLPAPRSARQVEQPGAALQHLLSNRKAGKSLAGRASSPHARPRLRGSAGPLTPRPPRAPAKTRRNGVRPCKALGGASAATGHAPALQEGKG